MPGSSSIMITSGVFISAPFSTGMTSSSEVCLGLLPAGLSSWLVEGLVGVPSGFGRAKVSFGFGREGVMAAVVNPLAAACNNSLIPSGSSACSINIVTLRSILVVLDSSLCAPTIICWLVVSLTTEAISPAIFLIFSLTEARSSLRICSAASFANVFVKSCDFLNVSSVNSLSNFLISLVFLMRDGSILSPVSPFIVAD